jgi:putative tryptophan/tyrosine transport system substrate-binding protein
MNRPPSPLTMLLSRHTKRREFIAGLGGAAAVWPLAARAQQPGKLPTIGFPGFSRTTAENAATAPLLELGWFEGRNIAVEYRSTEGPAEARRNFLAELVRLNVDVILTIGNADALEAKRATSVIPIVAVFAGEPIRTGQVSKLAPPESRPAQP